MEWFSHEIITMIGVGIGIIGLVLLQGRRLERRIDGLALQMDEQYRHLTGQMNEQFQKLSERAARVEDKFDLLETFVEHRKEPPAEAVE